MEGETAFRIITGIGLVLGLGIRTYFKRRLGRREAVVRSHEAREKMSYNIVLVSYLLILVYVFTAWFDFAHFSVPTWLRWVGGVISIGGTALLWWTHQTLGRNWSGTLEIFGEHQLVTGGPYRSIRHPMYSSFFLTALGVLLMTANWLVGLVNIGAVVWMYTRRVGDEEEMMIERFGESYKQYMSSTGRLIPRLGR